jgi:hypothetical protein
LNCTKKGTIAVISEAAAWGPIEQKTGRRGKRTCCQ